MAGHGIPGGDACGVRGLLHSMKTFLVMLASVGVLGCTSDVKSAHHKKLRLQGHVCLVAGGADFIVPRPEYRRFQAPKHCFPESVWNFIHTQPAHKDGSSLNGKGRAAWVDVSGHIEQSPSNNKVFVTTQVHHIGPAHQNFLHWRRSFGSGNHVTNYAD